MSESKDFPVPKWLTDLQQKSWEPEILLSGIVLYGMFKVPDLLDSFLIFFKLNVFGDSQDIDNLVSLFKIGIYWLIGGLILHLICRGIWIGMVGLSYTFPESIRTENLNYQPPFDKKVHRIPAYEQIVIRLEKISSMLFSLSFLVFMSLIGGYMFFFILLVGPFLVFYTVFEMGFSGPFFDAFQVYVFVVLTIGFIGLIDFLSLGYFRRFKWIAKLYWPLHVFLSFLTLSRFYRAIYYGMVTHFNKWAFFSFLTIFSVISLFGTGALANNYYYGDVVSRLELWGTPSGYTAFSGHYADQNQDQPSMIGHIPSDVVRGNVVRLFLCANINVEDRILRHTPMDSLKKQYPDTSEAVLQLIQLRNYYRVFIDENEVDVDRWFFHYSTQTDQRGYLTYLRAQELDEGLHELKVYPHDRPPGRPLLIIPFYRERTKDWHSTLEVEPDTRRSISNELN